MDFTVALTGATGFIGDRVARRLLARGYMVRALARPTSNRSRLAEYNIHWVEGALEDADSLGRLVRGADAVVHCAGAVRGATQAHFDRSNVDGVARLVRSAVEQQPVPRFLLISSLAARKPDLSFYAASKRQAETVLADKAANMSWVALRPPPVYGPGDREMLPVWRWMSRGFAFEVGSSRARFSMLYVDDLAEAIRKCLVNAHFVNDVFELHDGHPQGYAWQDIIATIRHLTAKRVRNVKMPLTVLKTVASLNVTAARIFGYAPMLTPGKLRELRHPDWVCDNTAFTRKTGWTPRVTLEDGLRRTLEL
ncbi:MAG: NAD-dependent epimerase/dehydratase family protein [Desulfobacterales bacterium]|jgi:nucleoside-diphosphate-sugar epimerase